MTNNISLSRDYIGTTITFGDGNYILTSLDEGNAKQKIDTLNATEGSKYLTSHVEPRKVKIEGYIVNPRTKTNGIVTRNPERMTDLKRDLLLVCAPHERFILSKNGYQLFLYLENTVAFSKDYTENNDQYCKFTINATALNPYWGLPIGSDTDEEVYYYKSYDSDTEHVFGWKSNNYLRFDLDTPGFLEYNLSFKVTTTAANQVVSIRSYDAEVPQSAQMKRTGDMQIRFSTAGTHTGIISKITNDVYVDGGSGGYTILASSTFPVIKPKSYIYVYIGGSQGDFDQFPVITGTGHANFTEV